LGLLTYKNRRPYNLYCVGADVKPCSVNQSIGDVSSHVIIVDRYPDLRCSSSDQLDLCQNQRSVLGCCPICHRFYCWQLIRGLLFIMDYRGLFLCTCRYMFLPLCAGYQCLGDSDNDVYFTLATGS